MKKILQPYPTVAIIGRTNVGKSTVFNRLLGKGQSLVSNMPGTTRDYQYGECLWLGKKFLLIDTAGLDVESQKEVDVLAIKQAKKVLKQADLIIFMVNVKDGLLPQDKSFAQQIKKEKKPTILVANKADSERYFHQLGDFYKLGFDEIIAISGKTGAGTGDLLDSILEKLEKKIEKAEKKVKEKIKESPVLIRVSLLGKPNVGKSSLLNRIIGEERAIVSSLPHTTRDSQDVVIEYDSNDEKYFLTFVDTAGLVRRKKIKAKIDKESIEQSLKTLKKTDLCLFVIDAGRPVTAEDKHITSELMESNKSIIFVVNKWDLLEDKDEHSDKQFIQYLNGTFPYLTWAPIVFVSAKTGFKVDRLLEVVVEVFKNQHRELEQKQLDKFLEHLIRKRRPRRTHEKGKRSLFIHKIKQIKTAPLTFELVTDNAKSLDFTYRRYVQNELREKFDLIGCGIKLKISEPNRKKPHQT